MAGGGHSFSPDCAFHEDEPAPTSLNDSDQLPPVKAQFFYVSLLPIDDPLSPVPAVQSGKTANITPQPFSIRDNSALERTWQRMQGRKRNMLGRTRPDSRGLTRMTSFPAFQSSLKSPEEQTPTAEASMHDTFASMHQRHQSSTSVTSQQNADEDTNSRPSKKQSPKYPRDPSIKSNSSRSRKHSQANVEEQVTQEGSSHERIEESPDQHTELKSSDHSSLARRRNQSSPLRQRRRQGRGSPESSRSTDEYQAGSKDNPSTAAPASAAVNTDMSGRPFARAPSSRQIQTASVNQYLDLDASESNSPEEKKLNGTSSSNVDDIQETFVPVGISRLHLVQFPEMQMKPTYWSPVNDISDVIRATWFYKDTMLPVPADVANRLEQGYEDLRPYTETYQDELNACVEHGAAAELKIVHRLWPEAKDPSPPSTASGTKFDGGDDVMDSILIPNEALNAAADPRRAKADKKLFESYSVVYINAKDAQMLRPNALPSVNRNRKPLSAIRKGRSLGVPVVRGFDRQLWQKLHPDPKHDAKAVQAKIGALMAQAGNDESTGPQSTCPRCDEDESQSKVTDLVLVIHGIGQKLSERVDSYNFTHAINELRRGFNVEMASESIHGSVAQDKGIMVLPVNWRLKVTFDESKEAAENQYDLQDITPESLPAVRSLISDVMLDIPYYMSHHKSKMTSAVIREANRVYRLWCRNNPGFESYGRVHLVAHSLGSVMAMEILSNQPTFVGGDFDLKNNSPSERMLEFDTTNLFCCGSPSGFFLLLHGANLIPRKGRNKKGMEGEDSTRGLSSEQGKYGCLAVDNIYNICHRNDPIAYCQNACVDKAYAASLQSASVPSASQSLFSRIGSSFRWASSTTHDAYGSIPAITRPTMTQMPSTVELETHNFTREEIAEKRMFLLNDNGQIDYFLSSGGGPLEIQYLNMLSAHSSYWILQDFVRFLVVEIGRKPGKENTLPALRAVKKRQYKKGTLS